MMRTLFAIAITLLPISALHAQTKVLTLESLEQAWDYALQHNADQGIRSLEAQQAQQQVKATQSHWLPTLSANAAGQYNMALATTFLPGELTGQPGQQIPVQMGQEFAYNAGLTLQKNLLDVNSHLQVQQSKQQGQVLAAQHALAQQSLRQQIATNYYTARVTQEAVALSQQDLALADSMVQLTRQRLEQGVADQLMLNQAQMNHNTVRQTLNSHQQVLDQCTRNLAWLLGMPNGVALEIPRQAQAQALGQSLPGQPTTGTEASLQVWQAQQEQAAISLKQQQASFLPTLSGQIYYGAQQFGNEAALQFGNDAWTDYQYANLSLSIPLFTGGKRTRQVQAAKIGEDIATQQLQRARQEAAMQESQQLADYQRSALNTQYLQDNFRLMQESRTLALQQYQQGLVPLDGYLRTFEDTLRAEQAYLAALTTQYTYYALLIAKK